MFKGAASKKRSRNKRVGETEQPLQNEREGKFIGQEFSLISLAE